MARILPGMESDMLTRREQLGLARRGVYEEPVAGWTGGRYANPARIAGTVPGEAGNVGPGYVRPNPSSWAERPPPASPDRSILTEMRSSVDKILGMPRSAGMDMPPDTRPVVSGMPQFSAPAGAGGRMIGAPRISRVGISAAPPPEERGAGSVGVGSVGAGSGSPGGLAPPMRGSGSALSGAPERPPSDMAPAAAPSSWSGAMSPIVLRPGVGLMEMKPRFGAYMRDEQVLAARRAEFDRNLGNYLKDRPPTWQSRAEYEREIAGLAGAGEEILPHIQQRANESMPVRLAQDWQAEEAERKASEQALIKSRARSAAEQDWLNSAPPGSREALEQNYISTPSGLKRIGMTQWEKSMEGYKDLRERATPEEWAEFHKNNELTDKGWRRKAPLNTMGMMKAILGDKSQGAPPSGAPPAGASVVVPPQRPAETGGAPQVGEVVDGYRFLGGNPANPNNWRQQ